jgi:hypothetical protein
MHNQESSDEDKGKLSIVGCHVSINDVTERGAKSGATSQRVSFHCNAMFSTE